MAEYDLVCDQCGASCDPFDAIVSWRSQDGAESAFALTHPAHAPPAANERAEVRRLARPAAAGDVRRRCVDQDACFQQQPHDQCRRLRLTNTNENKSALVSTVPLKRFATPEVIAHVIAFVASADASYMTGASIPVDGALSAD